MPAPHAATAPTPSANDRLKRSFGRQLWRGLTIAAIAHFLVLVLWPAMVPEDFSISATPAEVIDIPVEPTVPPPPEEIERPALPVVGDVDLDITIAPTDMRDFDMDMLPPPPVPTTPAEDAFTPYTVAPELRNRAEFSRLMERHYPRTLRDAGIAGTVLLQVFVEADGSIGNVRVETSSGYPEMDRAAERVMRDARFSPALNRDERVAVWVQIPIRFESR